MAYFLISAFFSLTPGPPWLVAWLQRAMLHSVHGNYYVMLLQVMRIICSLIKRKAKPKIGQGALKSPQNIPHLQLSIVIMTLTTHRSRL